MAKIAVDNTGSAWPSAVTIADLARFTPILSRHSNDLNIYEVQWEMAKAWPFEIAVWSYEYCTGYSATFKDGSVIHIGAWADGEEEMYQ